MGKHADRIVDVRAYVPLGGQEGGDYHARGANKASGGAGHWLVDSLIATPMSGYPEYKAQRTSWGIDALGGLVVEIETASGLIGTGISQGGDAAAFLIEQSPEPLPDRLRSARCRAHLGPDVPLDDVLRTQRPRPLRDQRRRSRPLGPLRQTPRRAGLPPPRRRDQTLPALLLHRDQARALQGTRLLRSQTAPAPRPRRRPGGHRRQRRPGCRRPGRGRARIRADARLLHGPDRALHNRPGGGAPPLPGRLDRGTAPAGRLRRPRPDQGRLSLATLLHRRARIDPLRLPRADRPATASISSSRT